MSAPFKPFSEDPADTFVFQINLPHWRQLGVTYFITWRLADSLPQEKLREHHAARETWLELHGIQAPDRLEELPEKKQREYHARFTAALHQWLDAGHGECVLRETRCAEIVEGALRHFDGNRYALDAFVIMPNHVHVLVAPREEWPLSKVLHTWKSFTAHGLNKLLAREGSLWQQESWNHIVRSEAQLVHYRTYIEENPRKAGLREGEYVLGRGTGVVTRNEG